MVETRANRILAHVALINTANVLRKMIRNDAPENAPSDGVLSLLARTFILKVSRTEMMVFGAAVSRLYHWRASDGPEH